MRPIADRAPPAEGRAKTRAGEANVERILDAALDLFARFGLRGARIEEIALAAGLSKTNLLYYFRSKDALYTAVLSRTLAAWLAPLKALDARHEPAEALARYIDDKLAYSRAHPAASRLFAMEIMQGAPHLSKELSTTLAEIVRAATATIEAWIAAGKLRPVAPVHLIFSIWAVTQHYADFASQVETLTGRTLDDDGFFEEARAAATRIILDGALQRFPSPRAAAGRG